MRRVLSVVALLAFLVVLAPLRADAITAVAPGGGQVLHFGDPVVFRGHDKVAGTDLKFWDGGSYAGCFPQIPVESSGDWECDMNGPWGFRTYPFELRVFGSDGNQIGDGIPVPFTVASVLRIDMPTFTSKQAVRITGTMDRGTDVEGVITRPGDASFKRTLACGSVGASGFVCDESRTSRLRRPHLLPAGGYTVTVSEFDSELGQITQEVQEFSVSTPPPPNQPPSTPPPTLQPPKPPPTPTAGATPTSTPTSVPSASPTATPSVTPTATSTATPTPGPPLVVSPPVPPEVVPVPTPSSVPDPGPDLSLLIGLLIAAFTTLAIAGGRSFATLSGVGGVGGVLGLGGAAAPNVSTVPVITDAGGDDNDLERETKHRAEAGWGDRSWTWRLPGHALADRIGLAPPRRIATRSPLVGRLLADAGYLRSILGIAWLLPLVSAIVLAGVALADVDARPLPPSTGLVIALVLLACVDALAGAAALVVFWLGVLVSGGLTDGRLPGLAGSVSVLVVLGLLWMALPLIGSATRPFRRRRAKLDAEEKERVYAWDRLADAFIAVALVGWVAYKLTQALAPFAGLDLAIADHAGAVGIATGVGLVLRFALEEIAEHGYPQRLHQVEIPGSLPDPSRVVEVGGALFRIAVLAVMAYVFLGNCWQLWVGMAMVGVWQVASAFDDKLPRSPKLGKVIPRGITKILVMMLVSTVVAALATSGRVGLDQVRDCFVIMAVPSSVLAGISLFAESPKPLRWSWPAQLAGAGVYIAIVVLVIVGW